MLTVFLKYRRQGMWLERRWHGALNTLHDQFCSLPHVPFCHGGGKISTPKIHILKDVATWSIISSIRLIIHPSRHGLFNIIILQVSIIYIYIPLETIYLYMRRGYWDLHVEALYSSLLFLSINPIHDGSLSHSFDGHL